MCTFISFINESMVYWTRTCSILLFQHRTFSVVTFRFTDHIMTTEVVNLCQGTGQLERLCCTSRRQCGWSSGYCCLQIDRSFRTASFWGVNLWTESCTSEPGNATYLQHLHCRARKPCQFKCWSIFKSVANLHMPSLHGQRRPQAAANDGSKH